ncbi:MAG: hypothetical protein UY35_C0025G0003 [Candidatus Saccharibacteria bacterium GW2011_GWC2_48_9]|nr:MAG: hypothetical protein UY35_C0025G0003 [Candidatus Saccharibacteria bacterium GW2011_GWC2_48_9]HCH34606.1 hypothetical protein [Candidatus Saccharibacteria bacterium]
MKKILISTSIILIIVVGLLIGYFLLSSPAAQATNTANRFMAALLENNPEKVSELLKDTDIETNNSNIYQRNYRLLHTSKDDATNGEFYLLYEFTDNTYPTKIRVSARGDTITAVKSGSRIGKIPSEDKAEEINVNTETSTCLSRDDLVYIDSRSIYARYIRGATMIFLPETSNYQTNTGGGLLLDRMADFYKKAAEKDFIFELKGYMQTSGLAPEDRERRDNLFQQRATKLQKDLVERDVPLDRITIAEVYNYYMPEQATEVDNPSYVDINVVNRCIDA